MEFQTTLQNGKAYSCTPLHSHLDVKQPFQDFTVKKTHLPELHRTSSVNPAIYIYKKEDKGNISPAWDRGGDVRVQPGGMMRHDPPVHCIKPGRSYWLTGIQGCCAVRDVIRPAARLSISPAPKLDLEMRQALILRNTAARD